MVKVVPVTLLHHFFCDVRIVRIFNICFFFQMNKWKQSLDKIGWLFNEKIRTITYKGATHPYHSR